MIGVLVSSAERAAAAEFFEVCKTPWEFWRKDHDYEVVVGTASPPNLAGVRLVLLYSSQLTALDAAENLSITGLPAGRILAYGQNRLPLYGATAAVQRSSSIIAREADTGESMVVLVRVREFALVRIGYNLFEEIRLLLTRGQPTAFSLVPTLDLHCALLRDLITGAGLPFVEVPPVPGGYSFVACLTHDVDHPVLRNHCCDATMLGYVYRGTIGSLQKLARGAIPFRDLCRNWVAVAKLPLVYLCLTRDEWSAFDRYTQIEGEHPSTFFVIPQRGYAGRQREGFAPAARAGRYRVDEIRSQLDRVISKGCEVAVHGLDSWLDPHAGTKERQQIGAVPGANDRGVRMHWLYFDESSPAVLEESGFTYDSTFGYNATVGYRAGTAQVFRPLGTTSLLELPLHVMDTALFYPDYLNLRAAEAHRLVEPMLDTASRHGGVFTLNWHDRSISPERLWETFYRETIAKLDSRNAWFATADRTVAWFRARRSVKFEHVTRSGNGLKVNGRVTMIDSTLPPLRMRLHKPRVLSEPELFSSAGSAEFIDLPLSENFDLTIAP